MARKIQRLIIPLLLLGINATSQQQITETDICVYGGTSAGVIAAYTAKKMHRSVILVEPGSRLGGLTAGGLGYTDIGNKYAVKGLALDFYRRLGKHYGNFEQWVFEPEIAKRTFEQYIREAQVDVLYHHQLSAVKKQNGRISSITVTDPDDPTKPARIIRAKVFIDCSYEGDLMPQAGVSYFVGREANSVYQETYNGVQLMQHHQFPDGVDPYKVPGKPESGLLWGISDAALAGRGEGDKKVQAYNVRICLTSDPSNAIPITEPEGYDPSRYELLLRYLDKKPADNLSAFLKMDLMPNHKTDINNNGPFSTDMIGENYEYPEADHRTRKAIAKKHDNYIKGLLYFIGHDPRMPAHLRQQMLRWGYPKDEYPENGHWSPQLYVREARRMIGEYVMTQANCEGKEVVEDGIGWAAYTMDSHNCQRIVVNGMVKNEGDVQIGGFGPYPVAYRSIVPKKAECANLLVPVCLSASHIAYGSIRMEPVFMVLAQSAATAASLAIDLGVPVQDVPAGRIQQLLKADPLVNGKTPEILIDNDDAAHVVKQGSWTRERHNGYGPSLLVAKKGGNQYVKFITHIPRQGNYHVYTYFSAGYDGITSVTPVVVSDGKQQHKKAIRLSDVKVEGQTSGKWISLGKFSFSKDRQAYVQIGTAGTDGKVIADAVLFIPE